jgi:hypothetical protein
MEPLAPSRAGGQRAHVGSLPLITPSLDVGAARRSAILVVAPSSRIDHGWRPDRRIRRVTVSGKLAGHEA